MGRGLWGEASRAASEGNLRSTRDVLGRLGYPGQCSFLLSPLFVAKGARTGAPPRRGALVPAGRLAWLADQRISSLQACRWLSCALMAIPCTRICAQVPAERSYLGPMAAGVAAGTASSLIRVPTEVIKSRLQTKEFTGALVAVSWRAGCQNKCQGWLAENCCYRSDGLRARAV